jgi:hypothetical protein
MRIEEFHAEEKERNEKIRLITATKNAALKTAFMAIVTEKNEAKIVGFIRAIMKHPSNKKSFEIK